MGMVIKAMLPALLAVVMGGCTTAASTPLWSSGDPPVFVTATADTSVAGNPTVDADDPALWADPADPSRALMFGVDKSKGLYVHTLDGRSRELVASGPANNVDLRTGFSVGGEPMVLLASTNDLANSINTYLFNPVTMRVRQWGMIPTDLGEPYGVCLGRRGEEFYLLTNNKAGEIRQYLVVAGADGPRATLVRSAKLGSQVEGCVVDEAQDRFYVGEENVALWRFDFDPASKAPPVEIDRADGKHFTADIEGMTIISDGEREYLIVSSQGDNTLAVYRIDGGRADYAGRFHVGASSATDEVTHTDGLDAWSGPIWNYPEGLLAIHDDHEDSGLENQNYKFVDWREVRSALNLGTDAAR